MRASITWTLAGERLGEAIADSGASGSVADAIDTLAAIRAFEISRPASIASAEAALALSGKDFEAAMLETYTIHHTRKGLAAIWIGWDEAGGRVAGNVDLEDAATRAVFEGGEAFGASLRVSCAEDGRTIARVASSS